MLSETKHPVHPSETWLGILRCAQDDGGRTFDGSK